MYRKVLLAITVMLIPALLFSLPPESKINMKMRDVYNPSGGTKGEITYKPADRWLIAWIGIGNVTDYMISNTLQGGGPFVRPPDWEYFDGSFPYWSSDVYPDLRGHACEYPAGSEQFYTYASGLWVNALCPVIEDGDTVDWIPKSIETAYSSDLGAMSIPEVEDIGGKDYSGKGLCFSTQRISQGAGEGEFLFVQPGSEMKDYQAKWPFVDTLINARRPDSTTWVHTEDGDVISLEDTYAVGGDYIPSGDATTIWIRDAGPYAGTQVGLRIEERTYCWNYPYNDAYFYINWKIKNMNPYRLRDVYVAHFMDNDIGAGIDDPDQGAWDDMMGFDRALNLTYSFDSDGYEPGWKTKAGYVGGVMCESPSDRGLTGVQTWLYGDPIDEDLQDALRYEYMARTTFMTWSIPRDIRQLASSGPFDLAPFGEPGDEVNFTVAIVVGETLDELKERARYALTQFENGYLGFSPPPSPSVEIVPADKSVYLSWDTSPESYVCPMSGESTFEGYRLYRSLTGVSGDWELLADYDLKSSYTKDTVMVKYQRGVSNAQIEFLGLHDGFDTLLTNSVYTIDFDSDDHFNVYNVTATTPYSYNASAEENGGGFCVKESMDASNAYETDPGYISGSVIYMDGFYVTIMDGEYDPSQPGTDIDPNASDQFVARSYAHEKFGNEIGIKRYYVDEDLTDGVRYYYSVNSYSRPIPYLGVDELEGGMTGKKYWAIPRKEAADYQFPFQPVIERTGGSGDIRFEAYIANPNEVKDAEYKIRFGTNSPGTDSADFWQLVRLDGEGETILIDSCTDIDLEATPVIDGLSFQLATVLRPAIDTEKVIDDGRSGWIKGSSDCEFTSVISSGEPRNNYNVIFSDTGSYDRLGRKAPFEIWNVDKQEPAEFIYQGDSTSIYPPRAGANAFIVIDDTFGDFSWRLRLDAPSDSAFSYPDTGDIYLLKVLIRTTVDDEFTVITSKKKKKDSYDLDSIRVVPNPYYVSAVWDGPSKYERKLYFQGLPSRCTIRIFNAAGLLLREIEHDETIATYFRPEVMGEEEEQGSHAWDLKTSGGYEVTSGLFIYQVVTPDGKEKVGKFAVVR
ncbi:hypothetical protein CH333_03455 [candidate division WOR-3 bacterium JGI_Cruoil_03_44_89]|uniref:Fibronectin type-III domain-containing protein n=1 Tax=candidate division WOR-3 bacterium JGI_Cruoil_03_44_89 TaxID=1973748 RepID=A0A235BVL5_UNCW3|nr:MAG: hypothetical protein CH333_03455 [candidate division WOR-3 bacterium JGI_Cruoil_03_44_89]